MTVLQRRTERVAANDTGPEADLHRLKGLLLADEHRQLDALRTDVSSLEERVGSEERFRRAVADCLVDALKAVEIESHRDLADVMAPLVIAGIRREIVESRDVMVEALYPITGRLVKTSVAASIRELIDAINRTIEERFSQRQLRLRARALMTRRPLSEIIIAEAASGRFDRMILIDRSVGAVLATTGPQGAADVDPDEALNLLGGLVAAVVEFANHALQDIHGDLRSIDVGGRSVLLRASPLYIVAAMTSASSVSPKLQASADEAFLSLLERLVGQDVGTAPTILSALHTGIHDRHAPAAGKSRVSPVAILGGLVTAALALWIGYAVMTSRKRVQEAERLAVIEQAPDMGDYPLKLDLDREAHVIRAFGLLPTPMAARDLKARLAAAFPTWPVEARIVVLSDTPYARATNESLRQAKADVAALSVALEHRATREDLDAEVRGVEQRIVTPERRLDALIATTALFFDKAANYRDAEEARYALSMIAAALMAADQAKLRIVGYADGLGTVQANAEAARARAGKVAADLESSGVDASRLVLVTTRPPLPITDAPDANRRVVFERVFQAE